MSQMRSQLNQRIRLTPSGLMQAQQRPKKKTDCLPNKPEVEKVRLQFRHTFQEYLKLALSKVIPQQGVIIDPQQACIYGSKEDCIKLKKKVQRELNNKHYKKVELKKEHDLDGIQYQLDSKFQARIYRAGFIEKALTTLSLYNSFQESCTKFRDLIRAKKVVIMRISAQYGQECMKCLQEILRRSTQTQKQKQYYVQQKSFSSQQNQMEEEDYEEVIEEEVNYNQVRMQEQSKSKPKVAKEETVQQDDSQSEYSINQSSSLSWTKTDSSQFMEEQQDELNTSMILEGNRSFA